MQVILLEDVPRLGKTGDIVKVKDGYARNFLLSKGLAVYATSNNVRQIEHQRRLIEHKKNREIKDLKKIAEKLESLSLTIPVEVGEQDKLYGSITSQDIADKLKEEGLNIDRRNIQIDEAIKSLGVYSVLIKLHPEITAKLKLWVIKN